ncbi:hypothetical protein Tsubulata_044915 [Turnera subulata]|uniref:RRM domain-containing protein n=1 Tax=Turnera subulata TaxID=218843 RepID=A0A9Q0FJ06_9ROSI|nr:hypothetical protein Tsubulata_044915 [Turnera subulata]
MLPTAPMSPGLHPRSQTPPLTHNQTQTITQPNTKLPSSTQSQPFFSRWFRKQVQTAIDNRQVVSSYVENLPVRWTATDVHMVLSKYGEVVDVYIPQKGARSGKRFGFVRYRHKEDVGRILSDINKLKVDTGLLSANVARDGSSSNSKAPPQPSYPDTVQRKCHATALIGEPSQAPHRVASPSYKPSLVFTPTPETLGWLSSCAFGALKAPMASQRVKDLLSEHGFSGFRRSSQPVSVTTLDGNNSKKGKAILLEESGSVAAKSASEDPFGIMDVIKKVNGDLGTPGEVNNEEDLSNQGTNLVPVLANAANGVEVVCIAGNDMETFVTETSKEVEAGKQSDPIPLSNSFGPLVMCEETDSESPSATEPVVKQQQPNNISTRRASSHQCQPTTVRSSGRSSSKGRKEGSTLISKDSVASRSQAVGRINQRAKKYRKVKRITVTGSVCSYRSLSNDDIGRVNQRVLATLELAAHTPSPSVSFGRGEAEQTAKVGKRLGWNEEGQEEGVASLAENLISKEAFDWSKARADG